MFFSQAADSPIRVTEEDGRTTVRFTECSSLTEANTDAVGDQLIKLVEDRGEIRLQVDLAAIEYLTSVALSKFVALSGRLRRQGGQLTLVNLRPAILKVFKVSRLDRVIDIHEESQAA